MITIKIEQYIKTLVSLQRKEADQYGQAGRWKYIPGNSSYLLEQYIIEMIMFKNKIQRDVKTGLSDWCRASRIFGSLGKQVKS